MNATKPRLLLVDDAVTSRLALYAILVGRFEVHTATDGHSGVAMARALQPHIILLDVVMPVMGGLEACRILRADPQTAATPIILVTSLNDEWDLEAGFAAGCTDYVIKPVDREELLAKVDSWLAAALGDNVS